MQGRVNKWTTAWWRGFSTCDRLTHGDIRGAVCLQEAIEALPGLGHPINDLNQVIAAHVLIDLCLYQLSPKEAAQESFDWLSVVRAQHPPARGQVSKGGWEAGQLNNIFKCMNWLLGKLYCNTFILNWYFTHNELFPLDFLPNHQLIKQQCSHPQHSSKSTERN